MINGRQRGTFSRFSLINIYWKIAVFLRKNGQGSVFTLRECAQSIFRIKITIPSMFLKKFEQKKFFQKNPCGWPPPQGNLLQNFLFFIYFYMLFGTIFMLEIESQHKKIIIYVFLEIWIYCVKKAIFGKK